MAMVGWVGAGMEVMVGRQSGHSWEGFVACWEMSEALPESEIIQ